MTTIQLQGLSRSFFLAIANGTELPSDIGPARAAAIGVLKRKSLVTGDRSGYQLTDAGRALFAEIQPPVEAPPVEAKPAKPAKGDAAPKHNERTLGYVAAVRAAIPGLSQTDDEIAATVWRVASVDRAVAKAKEAFQPTA